MDKSECARILSRLLAPLGFTRKGSQWVRLGAGLRATVALGKYRYADALFIDVGFLLMALRPRLEGVRDLTDERLRAGDANVYGRIDAFFAEREGDLIDALSADSAAGGVEVLLRETLLPLFETLDSERSLCDAVRGGALCAFRIR